MSVDTVKPLTNPMTMKIIASSAVPTGAETEKVLQIANDAELADIAASGALQGVERVELNFPKFTDGRAYSAAALLRSRYGFKGEIRAIGDVLRDQLQNLRRCGFDAFAVREGRDLEDALRGFADFSEHYQTAVTEPQPLFRRRADAGERA